MTTTQTTIAGLTAVEIDTFLAANWNEQYVLRMSLMTVADAVKRGERYLANPVAWRRDSYYANERVLEENRKEVADLSARIKALREATEPYTAEFRARGGWNRYYLVTNGNGHVHRETYCRTCFPTTNYAWLVELADCDEAAMVQEYGEQACTVCFPTAPTMKGFNDGTSTYARRTQAEKDARQAEKDVRAAAKAAKTLEPHLRFQGMHSWGSGVETVAGAKQELRAAIEARLMKDQPDGWKYAGCNAEAGEKAIKVEADARHALDAKGVTAEEVAKIEANVAKKLKKEYGI